MTSALPPAPGSSAPFPSDSAFQTHWPPFLSSSFCQGLGALHLPFLVTLLLSLYLLSYFSFFIALITI